MRKGLVLLGSLTLLLSCGQPESPSVQYDPWIRVGGPGGGTVSVMVVDPSDPDTIYAEVEGYGPTFGLYRSTNGGAAWTWCSPEQGMTHVSALAVDPTEPSRIYATTDTIYRSEDQGRSWVALEGPLGVAVTALGIDPANPATLLAGCQDGRLLKSVDHGAGWDETPTTVTTPITALAFHPADSTVAYLGTDGQGLFKSTDGGSAWFACQSLAEPTIGRVRVSSSAVYVTTGRGYRSVDEGVTWELVSDGLAGFVSDLIEDTTDPETLYLAIGRVTGINGEVFKSTDGGAAWTPASAGMIGVKQDCRTGILALELSPSDPTVLYAGTFRGGLYRSADGGAVWEAENQGFGAATLTRVAVDPGDPGTIYVGTSGSGVHKSTDGGVSWAAANNGITNAFVEALTVDGRAGGTVYAAVGNGGLCRSGDGGDSWVAVASACATALAVGVSDGVVYSGSVVGHILKSEDDGSSWATYEYRLPGRITGLAIDRGTPGRLYGTAGDIYASSNGGITWLRSGAGLPNIDFFSIASASSAPSVLYVTTPHSTEGPVYKTVDNAASWVWRGRGLEGMIINDLVVHPFTPDKVYAATERGVFQSTDGGANWHRNSQVDFKARALAFDPLDPHRLIAAGSNGVYVNH